MKLLFLMLVIANVLFGVYMWQSEAPRAAGAASLPLPELAPERIKLLPNAERTGTGDARPPGSQTSGDAKRSGDSKAALGAVRACLEWGALRGADLARASKLLESVNGVQNAAEQRVEGGTSYWVYIPPLPSRKLAEARLAELRPARVDEFYVVLDDPRYLHAISLGLFSTEAGARSRQEALARLGVKDAIVRPRESTEARVYLRIRDVPERVVARLNALRADFPGSEFRTCPADSRGG
jgi:SPOR domain